jgi:hypothetical protein
LSIENAMSQFSDQSIPSDKFLMMCGNLLHRAFIEAARTEAKKLFRGIFEGGNAHLATVRMEDNSTLRFDLSLDHSELAGKLNYSAFRGSVALLISNIAKALKQEQDIAQFNPEGRPGSMIFGVTAVTMEHGEPAVMVLGTDSSTGDAAVRLKLMYLDYKQFIKQQGAAPPSDDIKPG